MDREKAVTGANEEEIKHRKMEQDAMKAAKRANERIKRDDGEDEFSNIAPV